MCLFPKILYNKLDLVHFLKQNTTHFCSSNTIMLHWKPCESRNILFCFRLSKFSKNCQHRNFPTVLREVFTIWCLATGSFLRTYGFFSLLGSADNVFRNLKHRKNLQINSRAKISFPSDKTTIHTFKMINI